MKLICLILISCLCCSFHPFYVSVTDIKYNTKEKTIEVSCRTFIDDMEKALKKQNNQAIDLLNAKDIKRGEEWLEKYIVQHLKIRTDSGPLRLKFIGYEKEEEAIWSYFEVEHPSTPKSFIIENSLLYDVEAEQMNIVHVEVNGNKKSLKVNNPEKDLKFEF